MDGQTQRRWSKPELVVIARSQPEEAVLTTCKWNNSVGSLGSCKQAGVDCSANMKS